MTNRQFHAPILSPRPGLRFSRTCITPSNCETLTGFPGCIYYMRVRVLYHDHCFDGAASAAFFSRFVADKFYVGAISAIPAWRTRLRSCSSPVMFDGDVNAIVDFKYSTDPRLTWWFDHHQSAFLSPEDAEHFRHDTSGRKFSTRHFVRARNISATVARDQFGYASADLAELVTWADIVDGALFTATRRRRLI